MDLLGKKLIFCIPGSNFSIRFLRCWTDLIKELEKTNLEWDYTFHYNPEVHMARNEILGGLKGSPLNYLPWNGERSYNYLMWIDSDIVFKPEDFFKLLEHDKNIVSGLYYRMEGPTIEDVPFKFACATIDDKYLTLGDILREDNLIEVKGNGMGFMLVKYGVFESLKFPWFEPSKITYRQGEEEHISFYSEDMTFQLDAKTNGFKSYVDPRVVLGHEKLIILK